MRHQRPRHWDPELNLAEDLDDLPNWERDRVLSEVRGGYLFARSAAQRAYQRAEENTTSDALFETLWWIGALDSYMDTMFRERWRGYKNNQPWTDLINGILWARNLTLHDPLSLIQLYVRDGVVDDEWTLLKDPVWATRENVTISVTGRQNRAFAEAYDRAVAGRCTSKHSMRRSKPCGIHTLTTCTTINHDRRRDWPREPLLDVVHQSERVVR